MLVNDLAVVLVSAAWIGSEDLEVTYEGPSVLPTTNHRLKV
jgi:hypothetical protein